MTALVLPEQGTLFSRKEQRVIAQQAALQQSTEGMLALAKKALLVGATAASAGAIGLLLLTKKQAEDFLHDPADEMPDVEDVQAANAPVVDPDQQRQERIAEQAKGLQGLSKPPARVVPRIDNVQPHDTTPPMVIMPDGPVRQPAPLTPPTIPPTDTRTPVQPLPAPPEPRSFLDRLFGRNKPSFPSIPSAGTEQQTTKPIDHALSMLRSGRTAPGMDQAIQEAARISGVPAPVLYGFAYKESNFGTNNVATTSSARGSLQLLRGTFKEMIDKYGRKMGFNESQWDDVRVNTIMGAMYARDMHERYKATIGGTPSITELYLLYLLGPGGGVKFIQAMRRAPNQPAASDFQRAAAANPGVFYSKRLGRYRTFAEVYEYLENYVEHVGVEVAKVRNVETTPGQLQVAQRGLSPRAQAQQQPAAPTVTSAPPRAVVERETSSRPTLAQIDRAQRSAQPTQPQSFVRKDGLLFGMQ